MAGIPTGEELVARARAMVATLEERAGQAEKEQKVVDETIQEFKDAGFFRVLQPKAFGGYEMDPQVFFDIQTTLAEGCMSSAWVYGVVAIHNFQLGLFDVRACEDAWKDDDSVLISSSYQPVGKVERVEGGFKLSGHWGFSSGCDHCDWVFLGAFIPPENEGDLPDMRTFMLPRQDYEIVKNWDTYGLQGTGSHDIIVDGAFIPEYRTHKAVDGFAVTNPGNTGDEGAIFRIPWAQLFVRAVASSAIGAAQGALDAYIEICKTRVSTNTGKSSVDLPPSQEAATNARRIIDELQLFLVRDIATLTDAVNEGREVSMEDRIYFRYNSALTVDRAIEAVDGLLKQCGGNGIFNRNPIVRRFMDIHAARGHVANEPDRYAWNMGRVSFGQPSEDFFV